MQCECINVKHTRRCRQTATKVCNICGDRLCGGCATTHHYHTDFSKLAGRDEGDLRKPLGIK